MSLSDVTITEAEILRDTGWSRRTLDDKIYRGGFPRKITRSQKQGRIFLRNAVYKFFNPIEEESDPFHAALNG